MPIFGIRSFRQSGPGIMPIRVTSDSPSISCSMLTNKCDYHQLIYMYMLSNDKVKPMQLEFIIALFLHLTYITHLFSEGAFSIPVKPYIKVDENYFLIVIIYTTEQFWYKNSVENYHNYPF